jgi:hyperosmotically inducible periplasmic protein
MHRKELLGLALSAILAFGVAASARPDTKDAWLTTKAKIALLTADGVSASAVNVDTVDGRVTIHGKVRTAQEKARAETVVKKVDGVTEVKNLLQVVPQSDKDAVKATDENIEDAVEAALDADKSVKGVKVASVNKGVVLLSGTTPDLESRLKAIEIALACPGVRRVSEEIKTEEK